MRIAAVTAAASTAAVSRDEAQGVAMVFAGIGVLRHDRLGDHLGKSNIPRLGRDRGADSGFPVGRDRRDDRVLTTGEIVVVGPRRDPGRLGDVLDPHLVRAVL